MIILKKQRLGHKKQYPSKWTYFVNAHPKTTPFPEFSQRKTLAIIIHQKKTFQIGAGGVYEFSERQSFFQIKKITNLTMKE